MREGEHHHKAIWLVLNVVTDNGHGALVIGRTRSPPEPTSSCLVEHSALAPFTVLRSSSRESPDSLLRSSPRKRARGTDSGSPAPACSRHSACRTPCGAWLPPLPHPGHRKRASQDCARTDTARGSHRLARRPCRSPTKRCVSYAPACGRVCRSR